MPRHEGRSACFCAGVCLAAMVTFSGTAFPSQPLREFAYHEMSVLVVGPDAKPMPNASVYGYCRELNLVCPRYDKSLDDWGHFIRWHESFLGRTGMNGVVRVVVPPGKWGFFAAGRLPGKHNVVVVVWSDYRQRASGEKIRLAPTRTRHWELRSPSGMALVSKGIFLKPPEFPIWLAVPFSPATSALKIATNGGELQLWATGDATRHQAGFALSLGTVSDRTVDGELVASNKNATIKCRGGKGQAVLKWFRSDNFGLDGEIALPESARVVTSPGDCTLGYCRPITSGMTGDFVGQRYPLEAGEETILDLDTALTAGVDYQFGEADKKNPQSGLLGRLFLVDGNGHPLRRFFDAAGRFPKIDAAVTVDGKRYWARQGMNDLKKSAASGIHLTTETEREEFWFVADVGPARSDVDAVWEFQAPPGLLNEKTLRRQNVDVASATFKSNVPTVLSRHASNILAQAETLVHDLEVVSGRKRRQAMTNIYIRVRRFGASATHNGRYINYNTQFLFFDMPTLNHTFVHELSHNHGFLHGGLMELVVETTRCAGLDQISQQAAKWAFMDRMNGIRRKEVGYRNTGLYLYCYARHGAAFLQFVLKNEQPVRKNLSKQGFSDDEITAALCNLASGQDMTPICLAYGLSATATRIEAAARAADEFCHRKNTSEASE